MPAEAHVETAKRLLAHDSANIGGAELRAVAVGRVYTSLFAVLAPVIGPAGLQALLARSLVLTRRDLPALHAHLTNDDQRTTDVIDAAYLVASLRGLEPTAASEAATHLYATLFELLSTFIGEGLVFQILKGAFPALDLPSSHNPDPKAAKR
jgi:hypothetical protein